MSGTCPALDLYGSTHGNGSAGIEDLPSGILQFLLEVTDACYVVADVLLIGRKFYPAFMEADLAMGWLFFSLEQTFAQGMHTLYLYY